jgi:HPt (histidine-containing phosphotransfer) domain-containing protein
MRAIRCKNATNAYIEIDLMDRDDEVDVSNLLALRELQRPGRPDAVGRIVTRFLEETDERMVVLRRSIAAGDARGLEHAAHGLKGVAGTVGANGVMRLAAQLELIGRDQHTDGAADLVVELERALGHARTIFEGLRE